ncbi:MAG: cupin domain-containing protein [Ilumatobacteraceae bacterium]
MLTKDVSEAEMLTHLVRHDALVPRATLESQASGIPPEATHALSADINYSYMAPRLSDNSVITKHAASVGGDAGNCISISMAVCEPGHGPALHMHMHTVETFFCLEGSFRIEWGDRGEHHVMLEKWDLLAVPSGILRRFENASNSTATLLVIIQGDRHQFNDVSFSPDLARQLGEEYGAEVVEQLRANGRKFTAGLPDHE